MPSRVPAWLPILPSLVVVVLCLPALHLGYFWDDFYYLAKGQSNPLTYLLPRDGAMSYRPVPEGLYFLGLLSLGQLGRHAGHVFNLALVALSVFLLVSLVSKLSNPRAGVIAGFVLAALGPLPTLVSWTSCAPDAFAIALFIPALHLRNAGRDLAAFGAAAAALFCKEPVLVLLPVLVCWNWIVGRTPYRIWRNGALYAGLALVWGVIHPGFRSLLGHGFQSGATGYLGVEQPGRWAGYLGQYALTMANVPITGLSSRWPQELAPYGVAALGLVLLWLWGARRERSKSEELSRSRVLVVALLMAIPPIVLSSVIVRRWNPYFVCLPALGVSLLAGVLLSRVSGRVIGAAIAGYLALGIWCRGMEVPGGLVFTEQDCNRASDAIQQVERGFRDLHPSFPHRSQLLVSANETGMLGVYGTLIDGQAVRIWYGDSSLDTRLPERRRAGAAGDYLFKVGSDLRVVEIDPDRHGFPDLSNVNQWMEEQREIRSYARGLAATGEPERAVRIFEQLYISDLGQYRDYDLRLAAMVLLAEGKVDDANHLLLRAAPLSQKVALAMVAKILGWPSERAALDSCAFEAFGVSRTDPEAIRYMKEALRPRGGDAQFQQARSNSP